jgi:hypothetical protein
MYTYSVEGAPPIARVFYNDLLVEVVGPWDSDESAKTWAESFINKSNIDLEKK